MTPLRKHVGVAKNTSHSETRPDQPRLAFDGYEPPLQLRLSDRTRKLGLRHIALIREQLAAQSAMQPADTNA